MDAFVATVHTMRSYGELGGQKSRHLVAYLVNIPGTVTKWVEKFCIPTICFKQQV